MLKNLAFVLWILCAAAMLNVETAAQVLRSKTGETNDSILAKARMPDGAIALRDKDLPKEIDALKHAMSLAEEGTFITALSDGINNAIELVQEYQNKEMQDEGMY